MTVVCPGTTPVSPSSLVTDRSADALTLSSSVSVLLPVLVSMFDDIDAVFESPVALDLTNPLSVYVTELPAVMSSVSDMSPVPAAVLPDTVAVVTVDDQLAPERSDGKVSVNVAPVTSDGPLFVTTIV